MARTTEDVLKEIIANQIIQIASLQAKIEQLTEELSKKSE